MTPAFRWTLLWLAGSMVLIAAALGSISGSYVAGTYLPSSPDAFYHARRILDSVMQGTPVVEFDTHIHAPEGSWLTWPWGYDTLLARIVGLFGSFASEADANRVLMHVPVATAPLAAALLVVIARQLALPMGLAALGVLGVALLPVVFMTFAVGNIDHHYFEMLMTLATLSAGLWFFSERERPSLSAGVVLGAALGLSLNIHNGLFVLQIPVVAALLWRWLRGKSLPDRRQVWAMAAALFATALAVCLPSEPLQQGFFEFYTLSWFHLYVSACTTAVAVITTFPRSRATLIFTGVFAIVSLIPVLNSTRHAGEFLAGDLEMLDSVFEVSSPYRLWMVYGQEYSTRLYSWLLVLAVPSLFFNLWLAWTTPRPALQFFAISGAFMLALLLLQFRFNVFGATAMVFTPLFAVRLAMERWPDRGRTMLFGSFAVFVACIAPTYSTWIQRWYLANSDSYEDVRGVFPVLKEACARRAGIVLTPLDAGHWIRYHSDCSVIGNVFLLTPQHAAKARQVNELMGGSPEALLSGSPRIDYVFVFHPSRVRQVRRAGAVVESPDLEKLRKTRMPPLESRLLDPNLAPPVGYEVLWEKRTPAGQLYARLYALSVPR